MSIGFIFWLLMLIWLIFGFFLGQPATIGNTTVPPWGGHIFLWVLLALLGWGVFGFPDPRMIHVAIALLLLGVCIVLAAWNSRRLGNDP